MASVFFRGPKVTPRWFARFKDARGVWVSRRVRQETRKDALRVASALEAKGERQRLGMEAPESADVLVGDLMRRWESGLTNRSSRDDSCRLRLHVLPRFGALRIGDLTLPAIMGWLDDLRAAKRLETGTQRHLLNIVSRFFGWAIERGHATTNPCRMIPAGRRPQHAPKRDVPWLKDDATVRAIMRELPAPFGVMFYIGNRAGMRLGEICGLRLSDVEDLASGAFRVRFSYAGPLKEDKAGGGKMKWTPAPTDAAAVLGPWIERRRAEGAGGEAFLFAREYGRHFRKEHVEYRWERASEALQLGCLTWYQATRHSFASRNLSRGVPLDEVASALGHSTPAVTARHYAHFIRKTFSPLMTSGLGLGDGPEAKVIAIDGARAAMSPPAAVAVDGADALRPTGTEDAHAAQA